MRNPQFYVSAKKPTKWLLSSITWNSRGIPDVGIKSVTGLRTGHQCPSWREVDRLKDSYDEETWKMLCPVFNAEPHKHWDINYTNIPHSLERIPDCPIDAQSVYCRCHTCISKYVHHKQWYTFSWDYRQSNHHNIPLCHKNEGKISIRYVEQCFKIWNSIGSIQHAF